MVRGRDHEGEGDRRVVKLAGQEGGLITCEGSGGDVAGVLTILVGGAAQAFHDDRVVEFRAQLEVEEVDGEGQGEKVDVEREKRVKEGWYGDGYEETQNLSQ